jgi:hypothetical protein
LFGFLKKPKKGKIEKEFGWLTIERIVADLHEDSLDPKLIAAVLCRFAIFGGLDLKKHIDSKKLLKKAAPDRIVIEGIAITLMNICIPLLTSKDIDIHEDEELTYEVMRGCSAYLHSALNQCIDFELEKNYLAPYHARDLAQDANTLTNRLLSLGEVEMLGDLENNVGVQIVSNIYTSTMLPGIIESSTNLINIYLKPDDYLE